jgi:hypothetical protein
MAADFARFFQACLRTGGTGYAYGPGQYTRLEHVYGVVGAVEATVQALRRQIERARKGDGTIKPSDISEGRRYELRLAGLDMLHDRFGPRGR